MNNYLQALEDEAYNLSSMDGEFLDEYAGDYADGGLLDGFSTQPNANGGIAEATQKGRLFTLTVKNENPSDEEFYLCPGFFDVVAGHPLSGKSISGLGLGFTGSQSLAQFFAFIKNNPTAVVGLRFTSASIANVNQTLSVQRYSDPFVQPQISNINLAALQSEFVQQLGIVTAPIAEVFDNQTVVKARITGGSELTIVIFAGPTLNTGLALQKMIVAAPQQQIQPRNMSAPRQLALPARGTQQMQRLQQAAPTTGLARTKWKRY